MYLVKLPPDHCVCWLFLHDDPHLRGCPYPVEANVAYDGGTAGAAFADPDCAILMQSRADPKRLKRWLRDCAAAETE